MTHGTWKQTAPDTWEAWDGTCLVEYDAERRGWSWLAMSSESFVSGGYPGTPDWREYVHGEGVEATMTEAMWKCQRAFMLALVLDDAENWLMEMEMVSDPDNPSPDWWKVAPGEMHALAIRSA